MRKSAWFTAAAFAAGLAGATGAQAVEQTGGSQSNGASVSSSAQASGNQNSASSGGHSLSSSSSNGSNGGGGTNATQTNTASNSVGVSQGNYSSSGETSQQNSATVTVGAQAIDNKNMATNGDNSAAATQTNKAKNRVWIEQYNKRFGS